MSSSLPADMPARLRPTQSQISSQLSRTRLALVGTLFAPHGPAPRQELHHWTGTTGNEGCLLVRLSMTSLRHQYLTMGPMPAPPRLGPLVSLDEPTPDPPARRPHQASRRGEKLASSPGTGT